MLALRVSEFARKGAPVFGLGSYPGALLEVICSRMRWPELKMTLVDHKSTSIGYTLPVWRKLSLPPLSRNRVQTAPSQRLKERPSGYTSQRRAMKSVSGTSAEIHNRARTRPVTSNGIVTSAL